jgi:hypothetical protein
MSSVAKEGTHEATPCFAPNDVSGHAVRGVALAPHPGRRSGMHSALLSHRVTQANS